MGKKDKRVEKRRHPRISWPFVARFRLKGDAEGRWEVPIVKNISEGGCYFYCSTFHEVNQTLEIEIQFPKIKKPMHFLGKVKRCDVEKGAGTSRYGVAVCFSQMEEAKKKNFVETINFFLKKQRRENS